MMISRPDLLDNRSPAGLEVFQLTTTPGLPASHIYMEAQIFAPDSRRFLLHESSHAHGSDPHDPRHRYLVCDLENEGALQPITHETGAVAPSVSPDGRFVYYFVNETEVNGGRLTLKRVRLDGTERQTLLVVDAPLPGTSYRPSCIYPISSIRSDGKRLALSCFLGDGAQEHAPWGLMLFDLEHPSVSLILEGDDWCNVHPQYCRSSDPAAMRDILIQHNHGCGADAKGNVSRLVGGEGADIHVIREDGTDLRNMPWGRDGNEACQGHQCWRGCTNWGITSTGTRRPPEEQLIESLPVPYAGHVGSRSPGGVRNDLSRSSPTPHFYHFATDIEGRRLVTDMKHEAEQGLLIATFGEPGQDALADWTYLLDPRSSWKKTVHVHPFLSPDGATAFFNSDESGILQAYMARLTTEPQ